MLGFKSYATRKRLSTKKTPAHPAPLAANPRGRKGETTTPTTKNNANELLKRPSPRAKAQNELYKIGSQGMKSRFVRSHRMANSFSGSSRPLVSLILLIALIGGGYFVWQRFSHSISGEKLLGKIDQANEENAAAKQQVSEQKQQDTQQDQPANTASSLPSFPPPEPAVGAEQAAQQQPSSGQPSSSSSFFGQKSQPATPEQQAQQQAQEEMKELQQQQQLAEQREALKQQQREAVPSLLTDNPPAPVQLGHY